MNDKFKKMSRDDDAKKKLEEQERKKREAEEEEKKKMEEEMRLKMEKLKFEKVGLSGGFVGVDDKLLDDCIEKETKKLVKLQQDKEALEAIEKSKKKGMSWADRLRK